MADEAVAGLGGGEELLLGDLPVLAVAEGAPLGPALGGAAHLQDPALAERLDVVRVEAVERGDLLVELVLHRLGHRQHLLLQDLADDGLIHGGGGGVIGAEIGGGKWGMARASGVVVVVVVREEGREVRVGEERGRIYGLAVGWRLLGRPRSHELASRTSQDRFERVSSSCRQITKLQYMVIIMWF